MTRIAARNALSATGRRTALAGLALLWALVPTALVLTALAPTAPAQSYLSELPAPDAAAAWGASALAPHPDLVRAPLDVLFRMVDEGRGQEVYPVLRERFDAALPDATGPAQETGDLHRVFLMQLLRAGEGVAVPAEQERLARTFVQTYPDDARFPLAFFYLNQALFQQGKPPEDSFFFDREALESLPAWMQSRLLRMLAASNTRQGNHRQAATYLLTELESGTTLRQTTRAEVADQLERLPSVEALSAFLAAHDVGWLREREPYLAAKALLNAGQLDLALLKVESIVREGLAWSEADLKFVNDLKQAVRTRVNTRPDRIGVLLPIGSSSQVLRSLALETLEGLRVAVQFPLPFSPGSTPMSRLLSQDIARGVDTRRETPAAAPLSFELVIRDTGNDPQRTVDAVEALVREENVVAIIGPIARSESAAAADKAEELGVPLISLSLSLDIPPDAHYVFRHSKSQEEEVRDLVRYAISYLQARRFAILYPDTPYGHTMANRFWLEAEARGGEVVAVAPFQPSVRMTHLSRDYLDFKAIFQRFTGMDRHVDSEARALMDAVGDSTPDPIVDFDALYIPVGPDGVQDLQLIAPYPVTVDAEHVQLLGSRFWNDSSVLVAGDGKLEGAVFVDAFDLTSANPKIADFHRRHRTFFGHHAQYRPPTYYAGLGYDTANLLMQLLQHKRNRGRGALRQALVSMEPVFGVTGWTRFRDTGEAEKESMFFRIKGNEIMRILP